MRLWRAEQTELPVKIFRTRRNATPHSFPRRKGATKKFEFFLPSPRFLWISNVAWTKQIFSQRLPLCFLPPLHCYCVIIVIRLFPASIRNGHSIGTAAGNRLFNVWCHPEVHLSLHATNLLAWSQANNVCSHAAEYAKRSIRVRGESTTRCYALQDLHSKCSAWSPNLGSHFLQVEEVRIRRRIWAGCEFCCEPDGTQLDFESGAVFAER